MKTKNDFILAVQCPGRIGLVAAISHFLAERGCNIIEMNQFDDLTTGRFFSRIQFTSVDLSLDQLKEQFTEVSSRFEMQAQWAQSDSPMRALILVSQHDHCLLDILYRIKAAELNIAPTMILSNHAVLGDIASFFGIPFEVLPERKTKLSTKAAREERMLEVIEETNSELVVLARYMQILSPELCDRLTGRCINIHHSFLPGFKGAKPYHQAFERGVKQIGATAHYVTSDLDEGPIIEQEVGRVDHTFGPEDLRTMGKLMETQALAKAVKAHSEYRVFQNGTKTVVLG